MDYFLQQLCFGMSSFLVLFRIMFEVFVVLFPQVRGEKVERRCIVGLGHRGGQLRHLQEPHHGPLHRVPG
jgi:hypothetical protein